MRNKGLEDIGIINNCLLFFSELIRNDLKRIITIQSRYEFTVMTVNIVWLDNDDNIRESVVNEHQLGVRD